MLWEKRHYEKANWACITVYEDTYEQSICYGFMKIMKYICQQNSAGSVNVQSPDVSLKTPLRSLTHSLTRLSNVFRQLSGNDDTHRDGGPYRRHAHHPVPSRHCSVLPAHPAPEWPAAAVRPWDSHRAVACHHHLQQVCFYLTFTHCVSETHLNAERHLHNTT